VSRCAGKVPTQHASDTAVNGCRWPLTIDQADEYLYGKKGGDSGEGGGGLRISRFGVCGGTF
jgi:hypothetical protein